MSTSDGLPDPASIEDWVDDISKISMACYSQINLARTPRPVLTVNLARAHRNVHTSRLMPHVWTCSKDPLRGQREVFTTMLTLPR